MRRDSVLDRVVQDRGGDGLVVEVQVGQDARDLDRMGKIRIARSPLLRPVRRHRKHIGTVKQRLVGVRIVGFDPLYEFVLA